MSTLEKRVIQPTGSIDKLFQLSLDLICTAGTDGYFKKVNPAFTVVLGHSEKEFLETPYLEFIHPDDREPTIKEVEQQLQGSTTRHFENRYLHKDGSFRWLAWNAHTDVEAGLIYAIARDITGQKLTDAVVRRRDECLRMQHRCSEIVLIEPNESLLLKKVCDIIVETGGYRMAWVGFARRNQAKAVFPAAYAGFEEGYLESLDLTWGDNGQDKKSSWTCICSGEICITHDYLTDPRKEQWRDDAIKRGYASSISLPLWGDKGIVGALVVYTDKPHAFDADEVGVLSALSQNLSYGISLLRVKRENMRLASAVQHAGECIVITDAAGIIEYINPAGEELTGYNLAEARGLTPSVLKSGLHDRAFYDDLWKTIKAGRIWRGQITNRRKDGTLYEEDMTISPVTDATGKIVNYIAVKRDITREAVLQKARDESEMALRKSERRLRMLNECDEALLTDADESVLFKKICDVAVNTGGYRMAWVGLAVKDEAKTVFPAAYTGFEEGYLEKANLSWADNERGRGPVGICIRSGEIVPVNDIFTDSRMAPWRADALKRGYKSSIALPLRNYNEMIGVLVIYSADFSTFESDELDILSGLSVNLSHGIALLRTKRENERLASAIQNAGEGVVITDADGIIEYINPAYEKISGYSMGEVRGHTPRIFKSGLQDIAFYKRLWKTIKAGEVWHSQITNRKKDGTLYEEMMTISPIRDAGGNIVNFVTVRRDITHEASLLKAQVESAMSLRKSERQLRMLNQSNEAMLRETDESILLKKVCDVIVDRGGYRLAWVGFAMHDEAKMVLPVGFAGCEEGYLDKLAITWADTDWGRGPTGTCIRSGAICIAQNIQTDINFGPWRAEAEKRGYASSVALPLWDERELFGALMVYSAEPDAFNNDEVSLLSELAENLAFGITALRTKKNRDEAVMKMEKSRAMLHLIADSLPAMIAYVNPERQFIFVNKQFEKMYGLPLNQIIGKYMWEIQGEEVYGQLKQKIDRTFAGETMNYEFTRVFPDGVERYLNVQQEPQFGLGGKVIGLFVLIVDISEQVASRQKADRYRQEILHADKMRALGLLVSTVAHEVNNPLSYMTMNASMAGKIWKDFDAALRSHPSPPNTAGGLPFGVAMGEMQKLVGTFSEGAGRIGGIVARLKNFSRSPKIIKKIPVDLNAAVKNAEELTGALIRLHTSSFALELRESLPPVSGNSAEIEQVLVNLITNSCQAMSERAGALKITTSYRPEIEKILITVVDEGAGIPPDIVAKLAQPFFTTKGQIGGTGLGLMVSREIMEEHGGMLWFMSEGVGKGATAVMEFPVMVREQNAV